MISKEPFTASERRAVLSLAVLYNFRMLGLFMVLPLIGVYGLDLVGATSALIGIALGAHGLTQVVLQVPMGWASDRVGRKPVILLGLAIFVMGSFVAAMADTIFGVIVGRLMQGGGAISAALLALAADYTRNQQRTKAIAIIGASIGVSFVIALVLGPGIAALGGLSLVFAVTGLLGLIGMTLVVWVLPAEPGLATGRDPAETVRLKQIPHAVVAPGLPALYASVLFCHLVLMAAFVVIPARLAQVIGLPADHHWAVYLGAIVLSVPGVLWALRGGRKGNNTGQILLVALGALGIGAVLAVNGAGIGAVACGLIIFFTGFNVMEATLPSLASQIAPVALRGTVMGIFSSAQFLGVFVGGSLGGILYGAGGLSALNVLFLLVLLLWLPLLWMWHRTSSFLVEAAQKQA
ncbi:major facilitator family transporter [Luminiphilus syltensis NOR5-1B]|uniref:Major facilitator family transporter n=1 Tax=Luminiphilus syltensis NOR5-1B TaxID=565045 RepID=B8KWJ1_9GAMM|nr:MFS transporter [Luminiphilus syltensis]EED36923.1 major facilitator family transporter [Luminiphilus syltensis NOR5-1B]